MLPIIKGALFDFSKPKTVTNFTNVNNIWLQSTSKTRYDML